MPPLARSVADSAIAAEWDAERNDLPASEVALRSSKDAWWRGACGHSWKARVSRRTLGAGCPYCSSKQVLSGFNDLAFKFPEVAAEWDAERNGALAPDQVLAGSNAMVFWKGACGHSWDMKVASRTASGQKCPYCSGARVLAGFNDLGSRFPEVAAEWDETKKQPADSPTAVSWSSGKQAWWLCGSCSHEWKAPISSRTSGRQGCRQCAYRKNAEAARVPDSREESFGALHPDVAADWHPVLNGELTPFDRKPSSQDRVWWLCAAGHEWEAPIARRSSGVGCMACSVAVVAAKRRVPADGAANVASAFPEVAAEWHPTRNLPVLPGDRKVASRDVVWWLCEKGHEWPAAIYNRTLSSSGCPSCARAMLGSKAEKGLLLFLTELVPGELVQNSVRSVVRGELDIYIPGRRFAVEFNGLYWHSETMGKGRFYHHEKWAACKDQGIQLVQVWEDEWARNPEQVKRMLAHKLGVPYGDEPRVMARKTHTVVITKAEAEQFLDTNHVQGHANGTYYLALVRRDVPQEVYTQDDLLAVLVLKNEAGTRGAALNIIRYATSSVIPGGFTKLLTYAERTYKPNQFITFSDNCVSDGGLYANNGFVADKELKPDYQYVVGNIRRHKFGYRLKRFRDDPALLWEEGLTERELAALNGLHRIWDAGKTRWVKEVSD